jgi:uncharacterized protein (DUF302 family)
VERIRAIAERTGFKVLTVHDFAATLGEKGFPRGPLSVVELCNAKYASRVLEKDVRVALMLPCPIAVFEESGTTTIATMKPTALEKFYPDSDIAQEAEEVERVVLEIVQEAARR